MDSDEIHFKTKVHDKNECNGQLYDPIMLDYYDIQDNDDVKGFYKMDNGDCFDVCGLGKNYKEQGQFGYLPAELRSKYAEICEYSDADFIETSILMKIPDLDYKMLKNVDTILCNIGANRGTKLGADDENDDLECVNYRKVFLLKNGQQTVVYYKIAQISARSSKNDFKFIDFIKTQCVHNNFFDNIREDQIVYLEAAFVVFPEKLRKLESESLIKKYSELNKKFDLSIFENAAKPAIIQALLLLKKLGYDYIVLDPAPGFHPKTVRMTINDKVEGLVKIYEKWDMKKIMCTQPIGQNFVDEAYTRKNKYVMFGKIDNMIKKIGTPEIVDTVCHNHVNEKGEQNEICKHVSHIPSFYHPGLKSRNNPLDNENEEPIEEKVFLNEIGKMDKYQSGSVYNVNKYKYHKYKTKYLAAKNKKLLHFH
jgi:hypothetical protein